MVTLSFTREANIVTQRIGYNVRIHGRNVLWLTRFDMECCRSLLHGSKNWALRKVKNLEALNYEIYMSLSRQYLNEKVQLKYITS